MKTLLLAMALAQTSPHTKATPAKPGPVTILVIDDGDSIYGDRQGPDGVVVSAPTRATHASLVRIRENFNRQILESSGEVR